VTLVAAAVAVAAVVLTYLCCIRPVRRGQCAMTPGPSQGEAEVAALRAASASPEDRR
jgi:hypothetical protein